MKMKYRRCEVIKKFGEKNMKFTKYLIELMSTEARKLLIWKINEIDIAIKARA